jgi:hypothetical protein
MGALCYLILREGTDLRLSLALTKNKKEKTVLNLKNWIMVELRVR